MTQSARDRGEETRAGEGTYPQKHECLLVCTSQIDRFSSKEELTHLKLEGGPCKSGKSSGLFKGTWLRKVWLGGVWWGWVSGLLFAIPSL